MKSKIKKFINSKLFIFIITALVFSTIGVSAATYFASSQVTYDNKESGLTSNNVQGAIDELYSTCFPPAITGGNGLIEKVPIVTTGDGLYKDEYEDRYFYKGTNPNNYILFNNELWRILSLEKNNEIKIICNGAVDTQPVFSYGGTVSVWQGSQLQQYLTTTIFNSIKLNTENIISHSWSIGTITEDNNNLTEQISNENSQIWNSKIGLITPSEYLRANSDKNNCGNLSLNNKNYNVCKNTNWLFKTMTVGKVIGVSVEEAWTLTINAGQIFSLTEYGLIGLRYGSDSYYKNDYRGVVPVVYLSSNTKITGGDGSQSNPYTIK